MSEWLGKDDALQYIPVLLNSTFKVEFLQRFKPLHDGSKSVLLVSPHKTLKIVASQGPKTALKNTLDELGYNL